MAKVIKKPTTFTVELKMEEINNIVMALGCTSPKSFNYDLHKLKSIGTEEHHDLYRFFLELSESEARD